MKKSWVMQNLQGRRWLGDMKLGHLLDALVRNDHILLEEILQNEPVPNLKGLTRVLERAVLFKSDAYSKCVAVLLKYGADMNGCDGKATPYIVSAAEARCSEIVEALVEAGSDVNMTKQDGCTALHKVVALGEFETVKYLLNNGSDVTMRDNLGRTPLLLACSLNHIEIVQDILISGLEQSSDLNICNIPDNSGTFPLYYAVSHNNKTMVSLLISNGSKLNAAHTSGITPLMTAAHYGFKDCLTLLHQSGCELDCRNNAGENALLIAAKQKHISCFQYLKQAGGDMRVIDAYRNTLLLYMSAYHDIMTELLDCGVPPNLTDSEGHTPLKVALQQNHTRSVMILLQNGADPDPTYDEHIFTLKPLESALWNNNLQITQLLFTTCIELGYDLTWLEDFMTSSQLNNNENEAVEWIVGEMARVENQFPRLTTLCRWGIRETIGDIALCRKITTLPLPTSLKHFLMLQELENFVD